MKRIGLLGGSFDPVHNGHLEMAKQAKKQLNLSEVWFLLSNKTPLKDRELTAYEDRLIMLNLAIAPYRKFKTCTIERDSDNKNYTIDTVMKLKEEYPKDEFFFIIGGDQLDQLDKWKDIEKLQKEVQLCAFMRNGNKGKNIDRVRMLTMEPYAVSSSEVRLGDLSKINPQVRNYIVENFLYQDILKTYVSEHRYLHSLSVAKLSVELAMLHGLDVKTAYMAGIYHDINKEFRFLNMQESETILKHLAPNILQMDKGIWHGFIGSYIAAHYLGIRNTDVLEAIEHHVLGSSNNDYAKLVYISDKLDPLRKYDTSELMKIVRADLHKGFLAVKESQSEYYNKENKHG